MACNEVGKLVALGRLRHAKDLENGHLRGIWFDDAAAERAVRFFTMLRHSKGEWAGRRFELADWEEHDIIRPLFGWKRADGLRRFRTAYVSVARKNGKSTLAAGIGLYLAVADNEPGAEVYSAATKRDQARIVHGEAIRMVKSSPQLNQWAQCFRDNISVLRTGSKYEPLGADADTLDGLNVHGAIIDELHAHKTRTMWDVLQTAKGARRQPLIFTVTTAGFNRKTICYEVHDRAVNVLEGTIQDDSLFAYIATLDKDDDWRNQEVWGKANPNLGISLKLDYLLEQFQKALDSAAFQNTFRRLALNEWTEQSERYMDMLAWNACGGEVDETKLEGATCYGGLDLSSTTDLTACCLVFPTEDGQFKVLWKGWLPEAALDGRDKRNRSDYMIWAKQGFLRLTPGNVVDYEAVRADLEEWRDKFAIEEMAYDPWNATQIATQLQSDGIKMVEFRQGFKSMSEPTKHLTGLVLDRKIEHGGNPVASWMASNLAVTQDPAGNLKPDKSKATDKIDYIVALIMALGRAMVYLGDENDCPVTIF